MGYGDINIWASILPVNLEDFYEMMQAFLKAKAYKTRTILLQEYTK